MYKVTVLLSTYNGEKYIQEQLDSLYKQKNVDLKILVRDDGSTDGTLKILEENKEKGLLEWYKGDNVGPARSFLDLISNAPASDYYAFCDQDDYWLEDKLSVAIVQLAKYDSIKPSLYYGKPRLVNQDLVYIRSNYSPNVILNFPDVLVCSNATGCTMVFNHALKEIINSKSPDYIYMHDGWVHKICIIMHGNIIYDNDVHVLYRQHGRNVIGGQSSLKKRIRNRMKTMIDKDCMRSRTISELYSLYGGYMNEYETKKCLKVVTYKNSLLRKIRLLCDFEIKGKTLLRDFLYRLDVILGVF